MPIPAKVDVLIVGAGPVGLAAAIECRRHGLTTRIIDARAEPATTSRALGTHARTLEVYAHLGVLDRVLSQAQPLRNFTVHTHGSETTRFGYDFGSLEPLVPFSAFIAQADTECILRDRLAELGVTPDWNVHFVSFQQTPDHVSVQISGEVGETVTAAWLVGADGGHSTVRKQLGLPFVGSSDETWIVTDATVSTELRSNSIHMVRHPDGNLLMFPFPEPGKWRILETRPPAEGAEKDIAALIQNFTRRLSQGTGGPVHVSDLTWVSRFTIQQRQVPALRSGRVFLAGDAAHVHSPASGQGMNTGIQDAFNLVWKIALVHRGHANDTLLDSYSTERRPVSANLLRSAQIATRLIQSRQGLVFHIFTLAARLQNAISPLHRRIERRITAQLSAFNVGYGEPASIQGKRFPVIPSALRTSEEGAKLTEWLLRPSLKLLVIQGSDAELASLQTGSLPVEIFRLTDPDLARAISPGRTPAGWLIRPDGYLLTELHTCSPSTVAEALSRLSTNLAGSSPTSPH